MSKNSQWIVGVNAVASSIENDAENVREVLVEAGAKNPRLTEIEENARRKGIDVRKVNSQALDGVGGSVRHQGVARAMPPPAPTARTSWKAWSPQPRARPCCWCWTKCRTRTTSAPACARRLPAPLP
jgi:tRNA G18 (ribose-2'-O)-methylase SpoU